MPIRRSALTGAMVLALAATPAATAASKPARARPPLPLWELVAPGGSGRLYTLSFPEAVQAVRQGFTIEPFPLGVLRPDRVKRSRPLFRLRVVNQANYLVTPSRAERNRLVDSGQFVSEGVLGYVYRRPARSRAQLMRFTNGREWRLAFADARPALEARGYTVDGPVGYTPRHWVVIRHLRARPRRFRAGGHGTMFEFTLSERARIRFVIHRRGSRTRRTLHRVGIGGVNAVPLRGRSLRPGVYTVSARPAARGTAGPVRHARFRVVG